MHSTVQTGLFTPNIYNCEHNMYSPNGGHNRANQYHLPPHHHHLNYQRSHAKDASVHSSLLGINVLHGSHTEGLNKPDSHPSSKNNLSASNITFSSNRNLSSESNLKRHQSSVSISSVTKMKNSSEQNVDTGPDEKKNFFDYTKPCGFLTLVLGSVLLVLSLVFFVLVLSKRVCKMADTCANAVVILGAVSFLVIGIVMIFFGLVIVVYSKRDTQTKVIVARASQFDGMANREHSESNKNHASLPLLSNN